MVEWPPDTSLRGLARPISEGRPMTNTRRPVAPGPRAVLALLLLPAAAAITGGCSVFQPNTTNLLKAVNPDSDAVSGAWHFEKKALTSESAPHVRLAFITQPHGDYELNVTFSRVIGDGTVNFILPLAGRQVMLVLADQPEQDQVTGLEFIEGRAAANNLTADREFDLINHQRYKLKVTVRMRAPICSTRQPTVCPSCAGPARCPISRCRRNGRWRTRPPWASAPTTPWPRSTAPPSR